jgi:ribokinase
MSLAECKSELRDFLNKKPKSQCRVVVMPDFFLDRLINLEWEVTEFSKLAIEVAKRKGGSIDGIPQTDLRGGNAVNVASALGRLGVEVTPIVCTSGLGLDLIRFHLKGMPIDTSHVKIQPKASVTTSFEFKTAVGGKTNVMIRDLGSLQDFGPEDLSDADFELIEAADYTCVFNWAGTLRHGTRLAEAVFGHVKRGKGKSYFDTADPMPNKAGISALMERVLQAGCVDLLCVNENEAIAYASLLDASIGERKEKEDFADLAMDAARVLARRLPSRIDLHTTQFSATLKSTSEVVVPTFDVKVLRATGAGDSWNAGNILGDFHGLSDECRLTLANAVSTCYLQDPDGKHPDRAKLAAFLEANT